MTMFRGTFGVSFLLVIGLASGNPRAQQADYVIGAHDVLSVTVWQQPDLSGKFSVDTDGTFTFPLIGRVKAAGQSLRALESDIRRRLAEGFFKDPQVTLAVEQYHSQMVHLVGEVRQPGSYPLSGELRLIELLARAGSTTERAGSTVVITRGAETMRIGLTSLQTGTATKNIELRDGDTVFVPRAAMFFVFGEVRAPGTFPILEPTTVLQALALAGGLTERGSDRRLRIIRLVNGKKAEQKVKLDEFVQAGDTLVVGQRLF
jgi:polysaccharide export outer membrane protein